MRGNTKSLMCRKPPVFYPEVGRRSSPSDEQTKCKNDPRALSATRRLVTLCSGEQQRHNEHQSASDNPYRWLQEAKPPACPIDKWKSSYNEDTERVARLQITVPLMR
jgi:hypothetical protein